MDPEMRRKVIHILNGFWAFVLAFLPRPLSLLIVLVAYLVDVLTFRPGVRLGERAFNFMARDIDRKRGLLIGPTIYILVVLYIVFVFDIRVAAAAFALLAFGDGFATVIGKKIGSHALWRKKTIEGLLGFLLFGTVFSSFAFILVAVFQQDGSAGFAPFWFLLVPPSSFLLQLTVLPLVLGVITVVTAVCGCVELLLGDILDDNFLVPVTSCILLTVALKLLSFISV